MTDTLPLREQIARIIDGGAWQRHGFTGDPDWHPDDQRLEQRRSLAKADAIMALLPSLPDGWVDFVQGVADARNGEGMFWTTPDRDQDQDVIDRMGDAAVAMLAARPTLPTASGWDDAAVERAAQRFYTRLTTPHGKWSANEHQALWVAAMRAALAALSTEPLETER